MLLRNRAVMRDRIDLAVKVGAVASIALYIGGFVVVSIHDGTYGFISFNFFRARLISAGILLAFFIFIAALEATRVFGFSGLQAAISTEPSVEGEAQEVQPSKSLSAIFFSTLASNLHGLLGKSADLFLRAWVIGFLLRLLLQDFDFHWRVDALFAVILFAFAAAKTGAEIATQKQKTKKHAVTFAMLDVLIVVAGIGGLVLLKRWAFLELIGWFFLIALQTTELGSAIRSGNILGLNWHTVVPMMLATIGLFTLNFISPNTCRHGGRGAHRNSV